MQREKVEREDLKGGAPNFGYKGETTSEDEDENLAIRNKVEI